MLKFFAVSAGAAVLLAAGVAAAHVVVGDRLFPVTLTIDDPGVGDEATLPQFVYQPGAGGQKSYAVQWEYDKTITPTTALIYNQGYDILSQPGMKTRTGFENAAFTAKWQSITLPKTETVVSLGIIQTIGGGYATQNLGGDATGTTSPTLYFGQGFGALPIGPARPLAITGEFNYNIPDHRLNSAGDNKGNPFSVTAGFSVQYSIPYLQANVKHYDMPDFFSHLIPLVEFTYFSPAAAPANGLPTTLTAAPGVIYVGDTFQVGVEALVPLNKAAGPHVGAVLQVHFFFDDLFPTSLGKPIFQ